MKANRLRERRKALGLSQEKLGKIVGLGRRQIIRYEQGKAVIPRFMPLCLSELERRQETMRLLDECAGQ